ncbi:hypothetical protein BO71DRAFT_393521 [Aspergillus ellipticus CBS 707.79]|uniref:ABM domain-containing protein n=1 Tax=Aspergillus ellipticus CBS 707.79 TaxID=1448320 RepID=A0A319CSW8_9EURO|nr:hypothetical protein BO71DRAFT_393521 [Aspergillus ellipticus CBS 707.79]
MSLSLHITIHLSPSDLPTFWAAFKPVYEKVIAEPECTFFEVYESADAPGTVSWVENWSATKEWFLGVQIVKPYYHEYLAKTEPLFVKPREVKVLQRVGAPFVMVKRGNGGVVE